MSAYTSPQLIPYPTADDPVNVHEDMQNMASKINDLFTELQVAHLPLAVRNQSGETIATGDPVYISGFNSGRPTVAKSQGSNIAKFPVAGLAKAEMVSGTNGSIVLVGSLDTINTSDYEAGEKLYVGQNGGLTNSAAGASSVVAIVLYSHNTDGIILVGAIQGGNATWGALESGL
jgi:hypothetical protein